MSIRSAPGFTIAAVFCVGVGFGCRESADEPQPSVMCSGAVTISVKRAGTQPQFTWSPSCLVSSLVVTSVPSQGAPVEHWRVAATTAVIAPPVTYGRLPNGAQSGGLVPLTSNQDYLITVFIPDRVLAIGDGTWHQP